MTALDLTISRAGADKAFAIWLAQLIRAQGKSTLLQDEDFGHEFFMAQMHDALKGGARVIAIVTPDYLASDYCIKESNGALAGDPNNRLRRLVPFRLRPCAPSGMLGDIPYCDLLPELRARDANALAEKILSDLGIATRKFAGMPPLPDGLLIDPPPLVHPRIHPNPLFKGREDILDQLNTLLLGASAKNAALLNAGGPSCSWPLFDRLPASSKRVRQHVWRRVSGQVDCRTDFRTKGRRMAAIGYARVSTTDQDLALQLDALSKAGCARVFEDKASGAKADRPGLKAALSFVRDGDILTVWKLDRLGRSLPHLIETVNGLEARGVSFRSLTEAIDTTTPGGRLIFHIFGALGQFERDLIRERTRAGLNAAMARGRQGGRKPVVTDEKLRRAQTLVAQGLTVREAAARIKVGKTALYAALAQNGLGTYRRLALTPSHPFNLS